MKGIPPITQLLLVAALAFATAGNAVAQDAGGEVAQDTLAVPTPLTAPIFQTPDEQPVQATPRRDGDRLDHPVNFTARDSLVILFAPDGDPDGDIGTLFGEANTDYDDATLTAHEIDLLFQRETLRARGATGDSLGRPQFMRGNEGFSGRELAYNLASQRGRVVGARTQMHDGFIHGGIVVQDGPSITYAQDVVYTTCEYEEHNHWGLHTHRMKVVDGEWVYTGAAQLYILGIPTPVWLPFGFFPALEGRRSGPLPPDYGEQSDLGFYLRNIGYYWAVNDYMDLQLSGGLYTSGSYEGESQFRYARRYWYDGSLRLGYRFERRGETQDPTYLSQHQLSLGWRHNQTLNAAGTTRLAGNVDLRTSGYARNLASDYDLRVNQQTTSNLNFSHRWRNGRNVSVSYRQNLNLRDGSTNLTLPQVSFNQPRWFPFRQEGRPGTRWFDQISLQYSSTLDNTYRFPADADTSGISWLDGLLSSDAFREATGLDERFQAQARHNLPISAQFSVRRLPLLGPLQLDIGPNLTFTEEWFSSSRQLRVGDDGFAARDTLGNLLFDRDLGFTAMRRATFSVGASTRVIGTFPWRVGNLDGFRHEIRPTVSMSFAPDYSAPLWGMVERHVEPDGNEISYTVREGLPTPGRPQQTLNLSLGNVFQTRVASEDDTGEIRRRLVQLLTMDLNTSYDLSADSLRWRDVSLAARSRIADQVNLNLNATFSPYAVNSTGVLQNAFHLADTGRPLRFVRANFSASTSLRGGQDGRSPEIAAPAQRPPHFRDLDDPSLNGMLPYDHRRPDLGFVDFSIPWSLALDFNYGITRNFSGGDDNTYAALNTTFDFGLTPHWRISGRSGYDFENGRFVPTQISVLRELHCWEMSFTWSPFGEVQAFMFSIYVKSGHLSDLLRLDVPNVDRTRHF